MVQKADIAEMRLLSMKARDSELASRTMREHLLSVQWRTSVGRDDATERGG